MDTTLNIRNIDSEAVARLKEAAGARSLTIGRYIEKLLAVHDRVRQIADENSPTLREELKALGMETVRH